MEQTIHGSHGQRVAHTRSLKSIAGGPLWPHLMMVIFAAGWSITLEVGFRLYASEMFAVLGIAFASWRGAWSQHPPLRAIIGAYGLWVFSILLSDAINGTSLINMGRNLTSPILGGCSLLLLVSILSKNPYALLTYFAVTAVMKAVFGEAQYGDAFADQALNWANIQQDTNLFKVRVEPALTPFIMIIACFAGRKSLGYASLVLFVGALIYLIFDARSLGALLFLSSMTLLAIRSNLKFTTGRAFIYGLVAIFVSYTAFAAHVTYTINYNAEGHNGKQIARMDNPYNPFELLLQGRSEWLVMPLAALEKPFFGWGSWAEDKDRRFTHLQADLISDYENTLPDEYTAYIPVHSVLGAAWVWSGAFGFIAMTWLLIVLIRIIKYVPKAQNYLLPVGIFFSYLVMWHYFFSPPQHVRLSFPILIATLLSIRILTIPSWQNR